MSDVMNDLAALDSAWKDTDEASGFSSIPDGKCMLKLLDATIGKSGTSGRLQVKYTWEILEYMTGPRGQEADDLRGRQHTSTQGLDSDTGRGFMKRDLQRMEVAVPGSMSELPDALEECIGKEVEAQIRNKDGWCNVYLNGVKGSRRGGRSGRRSAQGGGGQSRASQTTSGGDF